MRIIVLFFCFCISQLGFGNSTIATSYFNSLQVHPTENVQFFTLFQKESSNPKLILIEFTDIELEEDFQGNDNDSLNAESGKYNFYKGNRIVQSFFKFKLPKESLSVYSRYNFQTKFCFSATPIFISNRVLRI